MNRLCIGSASSPNRGTHVFFYSTAYYRRQRSPSLLVPPFWAACPALILGTLDGHESHILDFGHNGTTPDSWGGNKRDELGAGMWDCGERCAPILFFVYFFSLPLLLSISFVNSLSRPRPCGDLVSKKQRQDNRSHPQTNPRTLSLQSPSRTTDQTPRPGCTLHAALPCALALVYPRLRITSTSFVNMHAYI